MIRFLQMVAVVALLSSCGVDETGEMRQPHRSSAPEWAKAQRPVRAGRPIPGMGRGTWTLVRSETLPGAAVAAVSRGNPSRIAIPQADGGYDMHEVDVECPAGPVRVRRFTSIGRDGNIRTGRPHPLDSAFVARSVCQGSGRVIEGLPGEAVAEARRMLAKRLPH